MLRATTILLLAAAALAGCATQEDAATDATSAADATPGDEVAPRDEVALGPVDGFDLPPTDLDRVQEGDVAPDFTLTSLAGPPVTLSDFRGEKNVVLVFYRGHW